MHINQVLNMPPSPPRVHIMVWSYLPVFYLSLTLFHQPQTTAAWLALAKDIVDENGQEISISAIAKEHGIKRKHVPACLARAVVHMNDQLRRAEHHVVNVRTELQNAQNAARRAERDYLSLKGGISQMVCDAISLSRNTSILSSGCLGYLP